MKLNLFSKVKAILRILERWESDRKIRHISVSIDSQIPPDNSRQPVIFFNASTRLSGLSLNAGFNLLASWAVRMTGTPVIHYVCQAGLSRCMLGTDRDNPAVQPPCRACKSQSAHIYPLDRVSGFVYQVDETLENALRGMLLGDLQEFTYRDIPLGNLVIASLRWALRRHVLADDDPTRYLFRQYIMSAWRVAVTFSELVDRVNPQAVVVFNGQVYPEATVCWVAQRRGIRVITHEVGLQPLSAFFTTGEATAYPIHIPGDYELSAEQNRRLDSYLEQRFKGNFTMAGIRFWRNIQGLSEDLLERTAHFRQVVPIFTNVIFDTSQGHANTIFTDMFAWLDTVLNIIRSHPETFFVIRAHPDEMRPGKESRESVRQWVERNRVTELPNVLFVDSLEYINSYELIRRSKFVMIYNSTIGLEASIMGMPVLSGGRARFTQYPAVFLPSTPAKYHRQVEKFLAEDSIDVPPEFQKNARTFLYYQLFRVSLPFNDYLQEDGYWQGYVRLKSFPFESLLPQNAPVMRVLSEGILYDKPFVLPE